MGHIIVNSIELAPDSGAGLWSGAQNKSRKKYSQVQKILDR